MSQVENFDYIIVGGGSAGCVLANRLSQDPRVAVVLLEAGPRDAGWKVKMPIAAMDDLWQSDHFNWSSWSEPEPYLNNRRIYCPHGKVLGGSSTINAMIHARGNREEYNNWSRNGCIGWNFDEVLPFFKGSESYSLEPTEYRGHDGPLKITKGELRNILDQSFLIAGKQAGYKVTDDFNGAHQEGFSVYDHAISGGQRVSASSSYLHPIKERRNLSVRTDTSVTKICLEGKRAISVEFSDINSVGTLVANKEIILSAGAIGSPQLLQRSGIGHGEYLRSIGIEVTHHLPAVGQNLQNHVEVVLQYECTKPVSLLKKTYPIGKLVSGARWFLNHSGICASSLFAVGAFLKSQKEIPFPNLQLIFLPLAVEPGSSKSKPFHGFQIHVGLQNSQSRGSVQIKSANPAVPPEIRFNLLSHIQDLEELRGGIQIGRNIISQSVFDAYRGSELSPGPLIQSNDQLNSWIISHADNSYHPTSTCQMGNEFDSSSVVNPFGQVLGLQSLRVVDASIMPQIVNANTNATVIMIAEKISKLLINSYR